MLSGVQSSLANEERHHVSEGIFTVTDESTPHPSSTLVLSPQYLALEPGKSKLQRNHFGHIK